MPKKNKNSLNKIELLAHKYIHTKEDWYPNYPEDMVLVKMYQYLPENTYRVCVWGADDLGMEQDYTSKDDAELAYNLLMNDTSREDMKNVVGLHYA